MRRFYISCAACGHPRMRLLAKFWKTVRRPEAVNQNLYQCPKCGENWSRTAEGKTTRLVSFKANSKSGWGSVGSEHQRFPVNFNSRN